MLCKILPAQRSLSITNIASRFLAGPFHLNLTGSFKFIKPRKVKSHPKVAFIISSSFRMMA